MKIFKTVTLAILLLLGFNALAVEYDDIVPESSVFFTVKVINENWKDDKDFNTSHMSSVRLSIKSNGNLHDSSEYIIDNVIINDGDENCSKIYNHWESGFPMRLYYRYGKNMFYAHCTIKTVQVVIGDESWYYVISED